MATMPGQEFASWRSVPKLSDAGGSLGGMLVAMGVSASGLENKLNEMGVSQNPQGKWQYQTPKQPVAPTAMAPVAPTAPIAPVQPDVTAPAIVTPVETPSVQTTTLPPVDYSSFSNGDGLLKKVFQLSKVIGG